MKNISILFIYESECICTYMFNSLRPGDTYVRQWITDPWLKSLFVIFVAKAIAWNKADLLSNEPSIANHIDVWIILTRIWKCPLQKYMPILSIHAPRGSPKATAGSPVLLENLPCCNINLISIFSLTIKVKQRHVCGEGGLGILVYS